MRTPHSSVNRTVYGYRQCIHLLYILHLRPRPSAQYHARPCASSGGRPYMFGGAGLLPRMSSIFASTSGVSFGMTSSALRLSATCAGRDAPRMTDDVFGFRATHASARCASLQSSSAAPGTSTAVRRSTRAAHTHPSRQSPRGAGPSRAAAGRSHSRTSRPCP
jgi:hypothetical protein